MSHPEFYVAATGAMWTIRQTTDHPAGRLLLNVPVLAGETWMSCHARAVQLAYELNDGRLPVGMSGRLDVRGDSGWEFVDAAGRRWDCQISDRSDLDGQPTELLIDDGTAERTVTVDDRLGITWLVTA